MDMLLSDLKLINDLRDERLEAAGLRRPHQERRSSLEIARDVRRAEEEERRRAA